MGLVVTVRKSKHGGKRPGAGRPKGKTAKPRATIAVSRELVPRLAHWAERHEVTLHAAADVAILHLTQEPEI